jgi:hypothetical protein
MISAMIHPWLQLAVCGIVMKNAGRNPPKRRDVAQTRNRLSFRG